MSNTILVTGGAGFIGSHVADMAIQEGCKTVILDDLSTGKRANLPSEAVFYGSSLLDSESMDRLFAQEKPNVIFHLAAQASVAVSTKQPSRDAEVNVLGTILLLEKAAQYGVEHVVFTSTGGAIYDPEAALPFTEQSLANPLSVYGVSKLCAERYLQYFSRVHPELRSTVLRLANVYGPRQDSQGEAGVVSIFTDKMLQQEVPVIDGDGEQTRDFIFVADVVEAFRQVYLTEVTGLFNVSTGKETSVNQIYDALVEATGYTGKRIHGASRPNDMAKSVLSSDKLQQALNWQPRIGVGVGIQETVDWFRTQPN